MRAGHSWFRPFAAAAEPAATEHSANRPSDAKTTDRERGAVEIQIRSAIDDVRHCRVRRPADGHHPNSLWSDAEMPAGDFGLSRAGHAVFSSAAARSSGSTEAACISVGEAVLQSGAGRREAANCPAKADDRYQSSHTAESFRSSCGPDPALRRNASPAARLSCADRNAATDFANRPDDPAGSSTRRRHLS